MRILDIDYYMIGAQSRDVWTHHLPGNRRITRDIDFAVFVPDINVWQDLTNHLIKKKEDFLQDKKEPYRFTKEELIMDLIPFGGIETDSTVEIGNPHTQISVYGCREVTEEAVVLNDRYKVISLPGLCILKLIAFDENPDWRSKDWEDFVFLMKSYRKTSGDDIYDTAADLITDEFDITLACARLLGRRMKAILDRNYTLKGWIARILQNKVDFQSFEEIDNMYLINAGNTQVINWKLVSEVSKGILDI